MFKMNIQPKQVKMIIESMSKSVTDLKENFNIDKVETKSENQPNLCKRRSSRVRKTRKFFDEETYSSNSIKRKRNSTGCKEDEEKPKPPVLQTHEELRQKHVMQITEVFRDYISNKLDEIDLPIEREKMRVLGLLKSLKNAISLKNKVYVSKSMGYLVTSSDGSFTYNVNPKSIANSIRYVCNCGKKYQDENRTSCKHCGSVIFHNIDAYFTDYLTKPYQSNVHLQLHHINKLFNKFDIENNDFQTTPTEKTVKSDSFQKEEDFFSYLLEGKKY